MRIVEFDSGQHRRFESRERLAARVVHMCPAVRSCPSLDGDTSRIPARIGVLGPEQDGTNPALGSLQLLRNESQHHFKRHRSCPK
jgi:hypothetical protein